MSINELTSQPAEDRLRAFLEHSPFSIQIISPEGRTLRVNRAWEELWGVTLDDIEGYNILEDQQLVEKGVMPLLRRAFAGEPVEIPAVLYDPNETIPDVTRRAAPGRWTKAVAYPIKDEAGRVSEVVLMHEDITARVLAEESLRETEARYRSLLENANDIIYSHDLRGNYLAINRAGERVTGYTREEILGGLNIAQVVAPEHLEHARRMTERKLSDPSPTVYEIDILTKDGRRLTLEVSTRICYEGGRPVAVEGVARDVTERKRAEAERARLAAQVEGQRRHLQAMVASVPGVVWEAWGVPDEASQRIDFVSDYVETMLGYTVEEWLSTPNFWLRIVHPEDRERAARTAAEHFEQAVTGVNRFRWLAKDGRSIWVETQSSVITDERGRPVGMRGVTMDISDRVRQEANERFLAEASTALSSSLDYETTLATVARLAVPHFADWCAVDMADDAWALRRLAVAHVDPAKAEWAREISRRYPPDPAAPRGLYKVLRTGESEFYPEIPDEVLAANARDDEHLRLLRQMGFRSVLLVPLRSRERVLGVITFVNSDSGRHHTREDLALAENLAARASLAVENARLYMAEQRLRAEAEAANRLKDEFLATVSHELRTPLTAIVGWSGMLRTTRLGEEATARAIETIERNARSQTQIIEDLLDVSRIITGKLKLDARPADLASIVASALDSVRPAAATKGIRLASEAEPGVGAVWGDPSRLQQVMWNLLSNAVKFTPAGGEVTARLEQTDSHVRVSVSDTGAGVAPEFLPFVFDRFRQADGTTTRTHGGLGLGLSIVRHLVEMHGGTVRAESGGHGRGATFTVELPVLSARGAASHGAQAPAPPRAADEPETLAPSLAGLRVLLVDDEADARLLLTTVLEQRGAEVSAAASAAEALDALATFEPDVLVSDIGMPNEDGYSLLRRVRALDPRAGGRVPAVALTAYAREEDRMRALHAGYQVHVAKPVNPAEFVAVVAGLAGLIPRKNA